MTETSPIRGDDGDHRSCASATSFRLLGRLSAVRGQREIDLGPLRQQAVLLVLLSQLNRTVPVDDILEAVWGEQVPSSGRKIVPPYVYRLRRLLCDLDGRRGCTLLVRDRTGYRMVLNSESIDLTRTERLGETARSSRRDGHLEKASAIFRAALSDWDDHAVPEIPGPFAQAERVRLRELRLALLEEQIETDIDLGRSPSLIPELPGLMRANPGREHLACLLMRALTQVGRRADALQLFHDVRTWLVAELGVEPGAELRDAHLGVLRQDG